MSDTGSALKTLVKRFLLSLPFFVISVLMFIIGPPFSIFAVFPLIIPAFIMVGPLSIIFSSPAGSIFNPGRRRKEPALMFSLPEARIMHGEYHEALEMLSDMIPRAPLRLEVYLRIIDLALRHLNEPEVARNAFHLGLKNLKNLEKRKYLAEEYRRLTSLFRTLE
ncbi:MAG: hypothetical protein KAT47_06435 [Candidatus Aegiribacteria sp.]|nr:hypothetical protein [Candidatus Aegiribacteria sp.]